MKCTNVILLLAIFTCFALISCNDDDNSPVVTQTFELDGFIGFDMAIAGEVVLLAGSTQMVEITGPTETINEISKIVNAGFWDITLPSNYNQNYDRLEIAITSNVLENMTLSASGSITGQHDLPLSAIVLSGSGNVDVQVTSTDLDCVISGSGNITASGSVNALNAVVSGSGNFAGFDLESTNTDISISGSGNCETFTTANLNVTISGSGNVSYRGMPTITQNITGSGQIVDAN